MLRDFIRQTTPWPGFPMGMAIKDGMGNTPLLAARGGHQRSASFPHKVHESRHVPVRLHISSPPRAKTWFSSTQGQLCA